MMRSSRRSGLGEGGQATYEAALTGSKKPMLDRVKLGEGGRLVIPAAMREAMGVKPGDEMALEVVDGELKVKSYVAVIRELQAEFNSVVPPEANVVDDFLRERREEQSRTDERLDRLQGEGTLREETSS